MAKQKRPQFPKRLYVYRERDINDDNTYLLCYETARECADLEDDRLLAFKNLLGHEKSL